MHCCFYLEMRMKVSDITPSLECYDRYQLFATINIKNRTEWNNQVKFTSLRCIPSQDNTFCHITNQSDWNSRACKFDKVDYVVKCPIFPKIDTFRKVFKVANPNSCS